MTKTLKSKGNNLKVGNNTLYNGNISIGGGAKVVFGKYCAIGPGLTIRPSNHNYNLPSIQVTFYYKNFKEGYPGGISNGPVIIGNDVWFGDHVIILGGVKVGDGVCIGAGSIVTKDLPNYAIAAGVPAKVIKYRYSEEMIKFLLKLKWWDWSKEKIKRNEKFFMTDLNKLGSVEKIKNLIK